MAKALTPFRGGSTALKKEEQTTTSATLSSDSHPVGVEVGGEGQPTSASAVLVLRFSLIDSILLGFFGSDASCVVVAAAAASASPAAAASRATESSDNIEAALSAKVCLLMRRPSPITCPPSQKTRTSPSLSETSTLFPSR